MELLSEEEQWDRIKAWVRTNGPSVLVLTAVLLLAWFGWKWWQDRGRQQSLAAGAVYQRVLTTLDAGRRDEAFGMIESLRQEYPKSVYVSAADMIAANVHVEANELDKAVERLRRVADGARDEYLRPIARLRLARVQLAQGLHDAALATLGTAGMAEHEPARLEVRGDVLLAQGDREAALKEYEAAKALLPEAESQEGGVGELLDLKIADLRGAPLQGAAVAAAPAASATPATPATPAAPAAAPAAEAETAGADATP